MNEICTLRQDLSSMQEKKKKILLMNFKLNCNSLRRKTYHWKKKQNLNEIHIIQSILNQNAELLKLNNNSVNNSMSQNVENGSRNKEKNQKD